MFLGAGQPAIPPLGVEPLVSGELVHNEFELQAHREQSSARLGFMGMRGAGNPPPYSSQPPRPPDPDDLRRRLLIEREERLRISREETAAWCYNVRQQNRAAFKSEMEAFKSEILTLFREFRLRNSAQSTQLPSPPPPATVEPYRYQHQQPSPPPAPTVAVPQQQHQTSVLIGQSTASLSPLPPLFEGASPLIYRPKSHSSLATAPPTQPPKSKSSCVTLPPTHSNHEIPSVHSHLWRARCKQVALKSTAVTGGVKKRHRSRSGTIASLATCKHSKRKVTFQRFVAEVAQDIKADWRFQSSVVPSLLGVTVSTQSNLNSASDFPVSDITSITNRSLMNEGCDGMSSVFVAKSGEIDENLGNWKELSFGKSVKGDGKQSDDVVVSTPAGVSIKNQMQCPDLYGNGRERYALPLLDEMPKSKVLCIVGKTVTSIRDKGGGVEHGSGVNYEEEDEYFVKSVEKDDQAGHVIIAKYEGRYETGDNLKGESLNNREGADVKAVTGNEKQVRMMITIALLSGSSMFVSLSTIKDMGTSMPNSACPLPTKNGYHKTDGTSVKLSDQGLSLCVESVSHLFDDMLQSDWLCNTRQKIVAYMGIRDKGGGLKPEFRENAILAACLDVCEDGGNLAGNKSLCLQVPTECGQLMQLMIMEIVPDEEDLAEGDAQHVKLSNERPEYDALQLSYRKLQLDGSVSDKREGDAKLGWLLESVIVPTGDKNFMAYFHEAWQSIPCSYQDWRARLNWFSAAMIQCSINPIVFVDTILLGDINKGVSLNYISKMEITANIVGELDEIGRWKFHITSGTTVGAGCAQEFNVEFFGRFVVLFKGSVTSPNNDVAKSYGDRCFAAQWYVQECDRLLLKVQKRGSGSMESKVASDTTLDEASIDISRGTQGIIKVVEVKDFEVDIGEQHVLDSSSVTNLVHMFSLHVAEISMTDVPNKAELQKPQQVDMSSNSFLFLPDKLGLTWLTFVDVAASTESELLECGDHKIQELMRPYVTMHSDHEGRYVSTCNSSKSVELHALQKEKDKGAIACIAGQAIVVLNVFRMHHTLSFGFLIGGGKDAEAAKKCVTTLTIPVCTPGCIPQYMDDTQYFGCSQLQVDYEGTEAQGQVMAPLMIMLIGGERCKGYYMAIRIAALRMYFFWCLLFGLNYSGSTCNVCYDRNLRTSLF